MTTELYANFTTEDLLETVFEIPFRDRATFVRVWYYIIAIFGIPGNILTLVVLLSSPILRDKPINLFIIHQSVIDISACIFTLIEECLINNGINGPVICHLFLNKYTSSCTVYVSTYNMAALTIERHFAIQDPLHYDSDKVKKRLPYVFIFLWLFCFAALGHFPVTAVFKDSICYASLKLRQTPFWEWMSLYFTIIGVGIPLSIMVVCYARMFYALYKSSRTIGRKSEVRSIDKLRLAQVNLIQICFIMIVLFLICWATGLSAFLLFTLNYYKTLSNTHYSVGMLMVILNSGLNPYIYVFRYDDFKNQLKKLCKYN